MYIPQVCIGGQVPASYQLTSMKENFDISDFQQATVQRRSSVQLDFTITTPNSLLRYTLPMANQDEFAIALFCISLNLYTMTIYCVIKNTTAKLSLDSFNASHALI